MQGVSGIQALTTSRRLLGEGAMYVNYGEVGERVLGASLQGEFDPGITLAQGDVSGAIGIVKGMDYVESCVPTLQVTLLEVTKENLEQSLPGGSSVGAGTRTLQPAEWFGLGTGGAAAYALSHDNIWADSLRVWVDYGHGPELMVLTTDYTVVAATGVVTFAANLPAASEAESISGMAPSIDMATDGPAEVDAVIQLDGGAPTPVVFNWAGCGTGLLVAAQIQAAIQALAGVFAAVTCTYTAGVPGTSDYYTVTGSTTGAAVSVVITDGGANSATHLLKLGVADGGTENLGHDAANVTAEYHYDPGDGAATHDVITADAIDEATDYVTNVAWVGRCADNAAEELIIIVENALPTETAPWTLEEKGNIGVQVTFAGRVTGAAPQTMPFKIRRPVPA